MMTYKEKLLKITTFIFDIDGVMTDGSVSVYKDEVVRTLNSRDGYAIHYAQKMGYDIFVITGGDSVDVKKRLEHLGVKEVFLKSSNKLKVYEKLKTEHGFSDEQALYMGDDIPDYRVMRQVGVATCPADAAVEIKEISDYQSPFLGGRHCVRDVIEQTLRVQKRWFTEDAHHW